MTAASAPIEAPVLAATLDPCKDVTSPIGSAP